jgi:ring-1,2-phenylacetyl-CoA epoxidase subunit PaaD
MVKKDIYEILETVKDPEIPVISILDLGIVREVRRSNGKVEIDITPTYSGCPALDVIPVMIEDAMLANGYENVLVKNILSPAWSTDWISENGLQKLKEYGIAPPVEKTSDKSFLTDEPKVVPCPLCTSKNTRLVSQFGSTPCKAAYQCNDCMEPFDYFKCH